MAAVRDLSFNECRVKSAMNNTLKDGYLYEERKVCINVVVNGRYLGSPSNRFLKEFNHLTLSTDFVFHAWKADAVFMIIVACLTLESIMRDQVEQNRSCSNSNRY